MRADLFLVEHGHATTRSQAQRLIAAGVQWRVDEAVAWKNGLFMFDQEDIYTIMNQISR